MNTRTYRIFQEDSARAVGLLRLWLYRFLFEVAMPFVQPSFAARRFMLTLTQAYHTLDDIEDDKERATAMKRCNLHAQRHARRLGGYPLLVWSFVASIIMTSPLFAALLLLLVAVLPFVLAYVLAVGVVAAAHYVAAAI